MSTPARRRVVITGLGVICPLGNDVATFWNRAIKGENGIERCEDFVAAQLTTTIAGRIKGFDAAAAFGDRKYARQTDPFVHYAVYAAEQAIRNAGLELDKLDRNRVGCIIGSGIGGLEEIQEGNRILLERGPGRINPFFIPKLMLNAAAGNVAIRFGLKGPNFATASACAAANHALGAAFRTIQYGDAEVMVCGGTEAAVTVLGMAGFCSARAMSQRNDDPAHASRPFDKERDGFVMGEGAGIAIFEELEHARRRGANIICEVVGFGATDDAFHMTSPSEDGEGAVRSMELALRDAGLKPEDVTYINAHGTSTEYNDKTETLAIKKLFGAHARKLMVSSTKSMVGHLLGASGAVELVVTALAIQNDLVPPTRNLTVPDPECDLDYVPHEGRSARVSAAISNSFGFGGHNATIALSKLR
ncbi:MAG: beta-ketoacyl-ACP synthase II [Planctomycetes bacterium]|jgi:3-oxoacyl-[acyl-carrier-protein] synthase II|nr:beta-ketoacyl-ACP synthase II [Planctomycetota bacterium]MCL4728873.1 beta-ketoacyl-ACP synthase II [Planctomycetota bacterium]